MSNGNKLCWAEARAMMMKAVHIVTVTSAAHKPLRLDWPLSSCFMKDCMPTLSVLGRPV
jgi:hypothetical protein